MTAVIVWIKFSLTLLTLVHVVICNFPGRCPQMNWSTRFQIIQGMAQGIAHLHTKNIIHMDLKPENILFDSNMNPKICDFEMCKILDQEATQEVTEELAGTLYEDFPYIPIILVFPLSCTIKFLVFLSSFADHCFYLFHHLGDIWLQNILLKVSSKRRMMSIVSAF